MYGWWMEFVDLMEALGVLLALAWAHPFLALLVVVVVLSTVGAVWEKVAERRHWSDPTNSR